jgi:hypothetical protein
LIKLRKWHSCHLQGEKWHSYHLVYKEKLTKQSSSLKGEVKQLSFSLQGESDTADI